MSERVGVVTGASKGIGLAIVEKFCEKKITTVGISRSGEQTRFHWKCDVRSQIDVQTTFDEIIRTFGQIDILVNNASLVTTGDILDTSLDTWDDVIRTNLTGTFLCCKYALEHMKKRKFGKIVNISSIAGRHRSSTASLEYTCSKYGIVGLTRQLALHYAKYGININCVCPSQTRTHMLLDNLSEDRISKIESQIPVGRIAEPHEIAEVVYFLTTEASIYVNGSIIDVNGGQL